MIKIVAVGKIKEVSLKKLIAEYEKRLSGYTNLKIIEVNDEAINEKGLDTKVLTIEGERLLKQIKDKEYVILVDLHGEMIDSLKLADKLSSLNTYSHSDITFVIGGSLGFSQDVIKRADWRWQLSSLTFTHQHTRLLVLEQIYRSYKINNNETYHK